ncbi:hypothetical protein K1T71_014216 [Dendrolimus kikuchii]|uniref:Uncharacterized protein n=1 Tax=Dendrolimus kikuchii TaxID=765133 RepID=A0ACC1CFD1_9NEOP|nr:hypothetical protein K1T71_014216 [Dendrolimus kikuchii]
MSFKVAMVFGIYCLVCLLNAIEGSFIKPNNIPRVGRSSETVSPYDQGMMGYVIKTNKNIPRIGRRNFDSENRFDIPKVYSMPMEIDYADDSQGLNQEQIESYYNKQLENMKR